MSAWQNFLSEIQIHLVELEKAGCDCPFFRGHSDSRWSLLSGLGRQQSTKFKKNIESILYYDFLSQAGPLLEHPDSSWDVLFSMQHHGLPTRLLDWSSTFAVGLYFALKPYIPLVSSVPEEFEALDHNPCIWVLNPFELNWAMAREAVVLNPEIDLEGSYQEIFIEESKKLGSKVMAVNPTQTGKRLASQRGCFTLHADLFSPLENGTPSFLRKFPIPKEAVVEGVGLLKLAGMNEYSLFPDLDGLVRHLKRIHVD